MSWAGAIAGLHSAERHQGRESQPRRHVTSLPSAGHPAGIGKSGVLRLAHASIEPLSAHERRHRRRKSDQSIRQKVDSQALRFHTRCWGGCPQPPPPWISTSCSACDESASAEDIRRAYRRLARRYHPDINPGDGEAAARFRDILSAYETLVDPERRRRYDHGEPPPAAPRRPASPASTSRRVSTPSARRPSAISSAAPSAVAGAPGRPQRGADLHVTLTVPLAAMRRAEPPHHCVEPRCRRAAPAPAPATAAARRPQCVACGGQRAACRPPAATWCSPPPAARCGGSGRQPAGAVRGVRRPRHRPAHRPARHRRARRHRRRGRAAAVRARPRRPPRRPARRPARDGGHRARIRSTAVDDNDLHFELPLAVHEAALGARIPLRLLDGTLVRLRVPPGMQTRPAVPAARARPALAARRPAGRRGGRSPADAAARARRAGQGAAAGVRPTADRQRARRPVPGGEDGE